jgi:hypothetical protein
MTELGLESGVEWNDRTEEGAVWREFLLVLPLSWFCLAFALPLPCLFCLWGLRGWVMIMIMIMMRADDDPD